MKRLIVLILVFAGLFSAIQLANANIQPRLKNEDVISVQVNSLNGGSRLFTESDGYEDVIISKVVKWINKSSASEKTTELMLNKNPIASILKIKMKNGDVAVIEPAYNCIFENQTKICTIADGEVVYTQNQVKTRLKSQDLYDWLLVGWKYESVGAPKDELLEETLYTRYFSYLDPTFSDFVMCPKIDRIERIEGSTSRHIVHASALNYITHHGDAPNDRIHITLTDTPEHGVKINKVIKQKSISAKEARIQCRRES